MVMHAVSLQGQCEASDFDLQIASPLRPGTCKTETDAVFRHPNTDQSSQDSAVMSF